MSFQMHVDKYKVKVKLKQGGPNLIPLQYYPSYSQESLKALKTNTYMTQAINIALLIYKVDLNAVFVCD